MTLSTIMRRMARMTLSTTTRRLVRAYLSEDQTPEVHDLAELVHQLAHLLDDVCGDVDRPPKNLAEGRAVCDLLLGRTHLR